MTDPIGQPWPLQGVVDEVFADLPGTSFDPTGLTREFYLDLAEHMLRQAVPWVQPHGAVIHPDVGEETATTTARFVGVLGQLIRAGRCLDLLEPCACAMDRCCRELAAGQTDDGAAVIGPEFYTKELVFGWWALRDRVAPERRDRWARELTGFDPWQRYPSCRDRWDHNFPIYAVCGEQLKRCAGLGDNSAFIDAVLDNQVKLLSVNGLYRDPGDPMTYDLTCRQQFGMMLNTGYDGRHQAALDEATRRGAMTQLLYTSVTGQMPYGGRSNQYHIMEGMAAVIGEIEARRYGSHDPARAGACKRAARLAARSVADWILPYQPAFAIKNRFAPAQRHGDEHYNKTPYACYHLLAAGLFATAYHEADESIAEAAAPTDRGGYLVTLWPEFHRLWATCGDYHLQLDLRGQPTRDATGLGRLHRRGVRPETALSSSLPGASAVNLSAPAPELGVAIGPLIRWGVKDWPLAACGERVLSVDVSPSAATRQRVAFTVTYAGDLPGADRVCESYELTPEGLTMACRAEGGRLSGFAVPLLVTDGQGRAEIETTARGFRLRYEGADYEVSAAPAEKLQISLEDDEIANNVGVYRRGLFMGDVEGVRFHFHLTRA